MAVIAIVHRPLRVGTLAGAAGALVLAMGLYCLLYNAARGQPETVWNAFSWPVVNLLPFLVAFEAGKRIVGWRSRAMLLVLAVLASLLLDRLAQGSAPLGFETVRRLPATVLVLLAWVVGDRLARRDEPGSRTAPALPLRPAEIDWIAASGNYVVLHGKGRQIVHRAPLSVLETMLASDGFVRIHRSRLVRRAAIRRVRPGDVVLSDGTSLPTGARFRALIEASAA